MSYYSEKKYPKKEDSELWFERIYFDRWFKDAKGPILDIGCSTGNFMLARPEIFEGVELDEEAVSIAQSRGLKVKKIDAETQLSQLEGAKYEGIYAKQIIEHLREPLKFLKEIHRLLKPGGTAIILTPNCPYVLNKIFWDDYTHKRPFTKKALGMIAFDAGFRKFKIYEDFRCFPGLGKLMRIFHLKPQQVRFLQSLIGIRGLTLILEAKK